MCPFSAAACTGVVPFLSTTLSSSVEVGCTCRRPPLSSPLGGPSRDGDEDEDEEAVLLPLSVLEAAL